MQNREPPPFNRPPAPPAPADGYATSQQDGASPAYRQGSGRPAAPPPPGGGRRRQRRPAAASPRRREKRTSWFTRIAIVLGCLVLLIGGGIAVLLTVVSPQEIVRDQLITRVKQQTGRDLVLAGGANLTFWPRIGVALNGVTLSAPPGMSAPPTLDAKRIAVSLEVMPLLEGKAVVESVTLDDAVIDLRRDANGRVSWQFAGLGPGSARPVRFAQSTSTDARIPPRPEGTDLIATLDRLSLSQVAVNNSTVVYTDAITGQSETVRAIDMRLDGKTIRDPLALTGTATARATKFNINARVAPPIQILEGRPADVDVKITSAPVRLTANGKLSPLAQTLFNGPIDISTPNVDQLSRLAGISFPNAALLGNVRIAGRLAARREQVRLQQLSVKLGDTSISGAAAVTVIGARPKVTADLTATRLDVDAISKAFADPKSVRIPGRGGTNPRPVRSEGTSNEPQSINDLLKRAPEVKGYEARDGWSAQPIDLSGLRVVDVSANLRTGPVLASGLTLDSTQSRVAITNGQTRINLDQIVLYKGRASGIVTLDPTRAGARLGANVKAEGVNLRPMLTALAGVTDLDGSGDVQFAVGGQGASEKAIMSSLNGNANIELKDGALIGWNIAGLIRGLQRGQFQGLDKSPEQKTDFSSVTATFAIKSGVATNRDLLMRSPLLRLTGEGTIDIGKRRLDYLAKPKLVASISGQGAGDADQGLIIPVRIKGSWDDPKVRPEVGDVLQSLQENPQGILDQARKLKEQFKGRKTGEVVDDLLRDNGKGAKELLRGLFNQ